MQPPEWIDSAPILVSESVEIAAPPSVVWSHVVDHHSWPEWFEAIDRVDLIGAPAAVGGGRCVYVRNRPIEETFTCWDVDEHFAFAVVSSKIPFIETLAESVRLEPSGTGTLLTYRQGVSGRTGFGWAARLLWSQAAKSLPIALANLKARVEAGEVDR